MSALIDTFVFFDLETTDLIRGSMTPEITELALVAVSRRYITPKQGENPMCLPRIMHKLTIPVCPQQSISPQAARITKLSNVDLYDAGPFDEYTIALIRQFIARLPGTICFVAQNGRRFDYKIFLTEVANLDEYFPIQHLCVDTLDIFKDYFCRHTNRPCNFQLSTVYSHLTEHTAVNQHSAEDDCLNLLLCARHIQQFAKMADQKAIPLNEINY